MRVRMLLMLVLLAGLVSAQTGIGLERGWNLVSVPGEGELSLGTCTIRPVGMVYAPYVGKFMLISEIFESVGGFGAFFATHSFWVYSYQDCALDFREERNASYIEFRLDGGWSFVPVAKDMVGNAWADISGECRISSIYIWEGGWKRFSRSAEITEEMIGKGFLVRSEPCALG